MRLRPSLRLALAFANVAATAPSAAWAQSATIEGASIERFMRGQRRLTAVNYRRTELGPRRVGLDVAVGFVPNYLRAQILLLDLDAGFASAVQTGPATLLLKGGATGFFAVGQVHDLYPGLQVGLALAVPIEKRCHVRFDLSRRFYFVPGEGTFPVWSVAAGLAVGPPR